MLIMGFSEALQQLTDGLYLAREAWGSDFVFIEDEQFTKSADGRCGEWVVLHEDLLAEDWVVLA